MAKVCEICGKKPMFGNNVSHAHNITKRRWMPNLQSVRAIVNGTPKRVTVCTSCLKADPTSLISCRGRIADLEEQARKKITARSGGFFIASNTTMQK